MRLSITNGIGIGPLVNQQVGAVLSRLWNYAQKMAELLEAVRASLRAKVAALADDNWMYEAEDDAAPR